MNITFVIVLNYELTQKGSSGVACIKILSHNVSDGGDPNQDLVSGGHLSLYRLADLILDCGV